MALAAEDDRGERGNGDQQPDRGHDLDQGRIEPQVPEQDGVEEDPHDGSRDPDGDDRRGKDAPAVLGVEVVVEARDEERHGAEREVEDARSGVGDDQAGRRDGVDPTEYQPGDHEFEHPAPPCSAIALCYSVRLCDAAAAHRVLSAAADVASLVPRWDRQS